MWPTMPTNERYVIECEFIIGKTVVPVPARLMELAQYHSHKRFDT